MDNLTETPFSGSKMIEKWLQNPLQYFWNFYSLSKVAKAWVDYKHCMCDGKGICFSSLKLGNLISYPLKSALLFWKWWDFFSPLIRFKARKVGSTRFLRNYLIFSFALKDLFCDVPTLTWKIEQLCKIFCIFMNIIKIGWSLWKLRTFL